MISKIKTWLIAVAGLLVAFAFFAGRREGRILENVEDMKKELRDNEAVQKAQSDTRQMSPEDRDKEFQSWEKPK